MSTDGRTNGGRADVASNNIVMFIMTRDSLVVFYVCVRAAQNIGSWLLAAAATLTAVALAAKLMTLSRYCSSVRRHTEPRRSRDSYAACNHNNRCPYVLPF